MTPQSVQTNIFLKGDQDPLVGQSHTHQDCFTPIRCLCVAGLRHEWSVLRQSYVTPLMPG
jgi:hypothetical protein